MIKDVTFSCYLEHFFDVVQHSRDIHNAFFIPYLLKTSSISWFAHHNQLETSIIWDTKRYIYKYLNWSSISWIDILHTKFFIASHTTVKKATQSFKTIQIFSRLWHQLSFANNLCEAYSAKSTYDNMLRWKIITFMLYDVRSFAYIILRILPWVLSDLIIIIYTLFHIDKHQHTYALALCTLKSILWNIYDYKDI